MKLDRWGRNNNPPPPAPEPFPMAARSYQPAAPAPYPSGAEHQPGAGHPGEGQPGAFWPPAGGAAHAPAWDDRAAWPPMVAGNEPAPAAFAPPAQPVPHTAATTAPAASPDAPLLPAAGGNEVAAGLWRIETATAAVEPLSASQVLRSLSEKVSVGSIAEYQPVPLGFTPLDRSIGGGLRAGELLLIGGAQGTGKTTLAMQMARNVVLGGQASVLYVCFEHDEEYLLNRLIAMESALVNLPQKNSGVKIQDVRREIVGTWLSQGGEAADLTANPRLKPALDRIARYGQNLYMLRGSQTTTTIDALGKLVEQYKVLSGDRRLVVVIDYMQKVPVIPEPNTETEKVTTIVNGLKDVALSHSVPMISIVAADKEGLKASRLRNHHLRGSSAINYEADIILILNEKYNIVAKVNIEFNPYQAQRFRDWVIVTVEKNRGGKHSIDLEFEKHFEYSCFDANGRSVQEKLIEERLYND